MRPRNRRFAASSGRWLKWGDREAQHWSVVVAPFCITPEAAGAYYLIPSSLLSAVYSTSSQFMNVAFVAVAEFLLRRWRRSDRRGYMRLSSYGSCLRVDEASVRPVGAATPWNANWTYGHASFGNADEESSGDAAKALDVSSISIDRC